MMSIGRTLIGVCFFVIISNSIVAAINGEDKCETIIDRYSLRKRSTDALEMPITTVTLTDQCMDSGLVHWRYPATAAGHSAEGSRHIVQFRSTNRQSFTVCLSFPNGGQSFSVHRLRGPSKKLIHSATAAGTDTTGSPLQCLESQCSHLSIMVQSGSSAVADTSPLHADTVSIDSIERKAVATATIKYQFAGDERCSKCTDQCMKNIFCGSDYMFIGTVVSSNHNEEGGRGYRSVIKLERFLRHNGTFLQSGGITPHPSCSHGNSTRHAPSSVGQQVKFPVQTTGEIAVHSDCHLEMTKKYFVSANFRAGLKHKGKLTVSCAQSDVGYAVFQLQQLMASPTHCCT